MHIVVTGAAGLIGQGLLAELLKVGGIPARDGTITPVERITAVDIGFTAKSLNSRIENVTGNINDPDLIAKILLPTTGGVFHLAAIVSSQAEAEFDLGMRVNLDAPRLIMERLRLVAPTVRLVTTSSVAVYGGTMPRVVPDNHVWQPTSSYGTQKAICDLLLNDYSRRGFLDGRSLRMPTIVVRPGKPNRAASSFASGIIREPLAGVTAICPVSVNTVLWLMSPEMAVRNLLHAFTLPASALGDRRVINMPGLSVRVGAMLDTLTEVGGQAARDRIRLEPDPTIQKIVNSWPGALAAEHAKTLGFEADTSFRTIVDAYMRVSAAAPKP